jgi:uncharacterized protein YjbJ (UPF0337 family)
MRDTMDQSPAGALHRHSAPDGTPARRPRFFGTRGTGTVPLEVIDMDEDRIEGAARTIGGKAQKAFGSLTGDQETEGKGMAQEAMGRAQNLYGNAVDSMKDYTHEQPISALLIAGGIGMALGMLIGRR